MYYNKVRSVLSSRVAFAVLVSSDPEKYLFIIGRRVK